MHIHFGIVLSGLWIFPMRLRGVEFFAVEHVHRKFLHLALIEVIKSEEAATGRPAHAVVHREFLFVNPVHRTVDDFIFLTVGCDLCLFGGE